MSSDSACSFETIGPDFAMSERSESVGSLTFSDYEDFRVENERLQMENSLLRMEVLERRSDPRVQNDTLLQSQIVGSWKLVSSSNVEEYLSKRGASEVSDIVFQVGDVHFEVDDNQKMGVFNQIGQKKYEEKKIEWGRPLNGSLTYFTEHCMKTVYVGRSSEGEEDVEEVSIQEGRLHIVIRRWGVRCERIYSRRENKAEKLLEMDIRKTIVGIWQRNSNGSTYSIKVEGDQFMESLDGDEYRVYTFGVEHSDGWTVTVEGNRIVQSGYDVRWEWYMENGQLIIDCYVEDQFGSKRHYERIGYFL